MTRHSREASTPRRSYNPPEQKKQRASMTAVVITAKCQWEPHKKHCHVKAAHRKAPERQKWKSSCLPWPAGKYSLFVDNKRTSDASRWTQWYDREGRESPLHPHFCRLYRKEINTSPRRTRLRVVKVSLCEYWRAALEKSRSNMVLAAGGEHTLPALRRARPSFFYSGLISAAPPAYLASQLAVSFWTTGPAFLSLDLVPDQPCHSTGVNTGGLRHLQKRSGLSPLWHRRWQWPQPASARHVSSSLLSKETQHNRSLLSLLATEKSICLSFFLKIYEQ